MPWLLQALLAVVAAAGAKALFTSLLRLISRGARRRLKGPKIHHVVLLAFPDLEEDSDDRRGFDLTIAKINRLPGIKASFTSYGTRDLGKKELLEELGKPDASAFMTHCAHLVADSPSAVADYLHGEIQTKELSPQIGKYFRGVIVMDTELGMDLLPREGGEAIMQVVMLRFQAHVTKDSAVYRSFQGVVAEFSKHPGVRACLRHAGYGDLTAEGLYKAMDWPDRRMGHTHCLLITAESLAQLKSLLASEIYSKWMNIERPHLINDGLPPVVIFHAPLEVEATMY